MASTAIDSYDVHVGLWTNWTYGKVDGLTITLQQRDAQLLIAFIAFFVTLISVHVWKILCFFIHYLLSTSDRRDVLHHQRQALLRNALSPTSLAWMLFQLWWTWKKSSKVYGRLLPLISFTLLISALVALATGFSSRLTRSDNEVLLRGSHCGMPTAAFGELQAYFEQMFPTSADRVSSAFNYVSQCYINTSLTLSECDSMVKPRIDMKEPASCPCPFGDLCKNSTGICLDTGMINSHEDLGVNAPEDQRFAFRTTWQCAPISTTGYTMNVNISGDRPYTFYNYTAGSDDTLNVTFIAPSDRAEEDQSSRSKAKVQYPSGGSALQADYALGSQKSFVSYDDTYNFSSDVGESSFAPIPQLMSDTADTELIFLSSNAIRYIGEVTDPWYQATQPFKGISVDHAGDIPTFITTEPASPLACFVQSQFCNPTMPTENQCPPLNGIYPAQNLAVSYLKHQREQESLDWLASFMTITPSIATDVLGSKALLSKQSLAKGIQAALPENQWEIEVQHWLNIGLAYLQRFMVLSAAGDSSHMSDSHMRRPNTTGEYQICQNQKIKSRAYVSFSFLGLLLVLIFGLLIVALSLSIEPISRFLHRRTKRNDLKLLEWNTNSSLQLQRLAFDGLGIGEWSGCDKTVPYTSKALKLEPLDISNPEHPRISVPRESSRRDSSMEAGSDTTLGDNSGSEHVATSPPPSASPE